MREITTFINVIFIMILRFVSVWPIIWQCEKESERYPEKEVSLGLTVAKGWTLREILPIPRTLMAIIYVIAMGRTRERINRYWSDDYGFGGATVGDISASVVFSMPLYLVTDVALYLLISNWLAN